MPFDVYFVFTCRQEVGISGASVAAYTVKPHMAWTVGATDACDLPGVPEAARTAKFVCVITCLWPDGRKIVARGECPGVITREVHGENGFGYDPVFYLPELGMTYAELPSEQKNAISHRARALQDFCRKYQEVQNHDK